MSIQVSTSSLSIHSQNGGNVLKAKDTNTGKIVSIENVSQKQAIDHGQGGRNKNKQKITEELQKTIPKPYVPNNKSMEVSSKFAKSTPADPDFNELHVVNDFDKEKVEDPNVVCNNQTHQRDKATKIPNPPYPWVAHTVVTKLRAQKAVKMSTIGLHLQRLLQNKSCQQWCSGLRIECETC